MLGRSANLYVNNVVIFYRNYVSRTCLILFFVQVLKIKLFYYFQRFFFIFAVKI